MRHVSARVLRLFLSYSLFLLCIFSYRSAFAKDYSFSWTANPEPVSGYKLYYKKGGTAGPPFNGTDANEGPSPITVGKVTSYTITGLQPNTTYYFALTAYNAYGESGYSAVITVYSTDQPSAVIDTDKQTGEAPLSVNFDATSSTGTINSYSWNFGDGQSATGSTASHTYTSSGTYTATLAVQGANSSTDQASVTITVNATTPPQSSTSPTADISLDSNTGVAPFTVNFNGSNSTTAQPPIISYSWNFGDGESGSGASISHRYATPGTCTVTLTVTDSANQTGQNSVPIVITPGSSAPNQPPTSSFVPSSVLGVPPLTVSFDGSLSSDSDGSITDYLWDFGDGTTAHGSSQKHTFTTLGDYTVTLTVMDNQGAKATSAQTVSVVTETAYQQKIMKKKNATMLNIINLLLLLKH